MVFRELAAFGGKKKPSQRDLAEAVLKAIHTMGFVRYFKEKDIPQDVLDMVLEAGTKAPSAGNHQPWEFIVVREEGLKKHIQEASFEEDWMVYAPVYVVVCINTKVAATTFGERGEKLYGIQDTAAAAENMLLAAHSLGLGVSWIGGFSEPQVKTLLECPEFIRPAAILLLGWPAEEPELHPRHSLSQVAHYERFGNNEQFKRSNPRERRYSH